MNCPKCNYPNMVGEDAPFAPMRCLGCGLKFYRKPSPRVTTERIFELTKGNQNDSDEMAAVAQECVERAHELDLCRKILMRASVCQEAIKKSGHDLHTIDLLRAVTERMENLTLDDPD